MNILSLCMVSIIAVAVSISLKKQLPAYHLILIVAIGIMITFYILNSSAPILGRIANLFSRSKIDPVYSSVFLKSLGICFVTQFASDACKDAGESALANKIELAGKIAIAVVSLPIFEEIIDISTKIVGAA